ASPLLTPNAPHPAAKNLKGGKQTMISRGGSARGGRASQWRLGRKRASGLLSALAAGLMALCTAMPALAHYGDDDNTGEDMAVTGELTVIQVDKFDEHRSEVLYKLQDKNTHKNHELHFKGEAPADLRSGSLVTVHGKGKDGKIDVSDNGVQVLAQAEASVS